MEFSRKALSDKLTLKPYWGKPAVRNFRGGDGDVGIIRSPVRAIALLDLLSATWRLNSKLQGGMKALRSSRLRGSFFHTLSRKADTRVQILLQEKKPSVLLDRVPDWVILLAF